MAKMKKKGVLLTIGLAFYCVALLTLATALIEHTRESRETGAEATVVQRVTQTFEGIEKAARDVFEITSGITLSLNDSSVTFSETLTNAQAAGYQTAIALLESFAEANAGQSGLLVQMDTLPSRSTMSFLIKPYNISVSHDTYGGDEFTVTPQSINFESYAIRLAVSNNTYNYNIAAGNDFDLSINNGTVLVNITDGVAKISSAIGGVDFEFGIVFSDFSGKEPEVYLTDTISVSSTTAQSERVSRVRLV